MTNTELTNEQQWKLLVLMLLKIAEAKKISQQEIANRTGLKQPNISRMFKLQYCPNLRTFISVSKAIGIKFLIEDQDICDLDKIFEAAMSELSCPKESNDYLTAGTPVRRKSDGITGVIEKFGHRFGVGIKAYNAYIVRWDDGNIGYPNEKDFDICS